MSEFVLSAAKGGKKAMRALLSANVAEVYALSLLLLKDEKQAAEVTVKAINGAWSQIIVKDVKTDKGFSRFVKCEAARLAAEIIFGKDIKNFKIARVDGGKPIEVCSEGFTGDTELELARLESALDEIDPRERFVYLLKTAGDLGLVFAGNVIVQREAVARYYYEKALESLKSKEAVTLSTAASVYKNYINTVKVPETVTAECEKAIKERAVFELPSKKAMSAIASVVIALLLSVTAFVILKSQFDKAAEKGKAEGSYTTTTDTADKSGNEAAVKKYTGYVPPEIDATKSYTAEIKIKNYGSVTVELAPDEAPMTVANFVDLANKGFYNGLTFHRIIDGFMMQGGDPKGNGTGGSDNNIFGEFASNGFVNNLKHEKGVISMARSGDPNSASSQFFIMQDTAEHLDGDYAAFGKVTAGQDIVDKICKDAKPTDGNGTIPAANQPIIESVTVTVK